MAYAMSSGIGTVMISSQAEQYAGDDTVIITVRFSLQGDVRDSFNEDNWTRAYNNNDNVFKLKYKIKLVAGGLRKKEVGDTVDTYRKASIFWTRNPKLVNPMAEKRVWVQVAKNFVPYIRLTEEEVRQELFDFEEEFRFNASELGAGNHKFAAEISASWQKHDYIDAGSAKGSGGELRVAIC